MLSASIHYDPILLTHVDILSRLGTQEASLIADLCADPSIDLHVPRTDNAVRFGLKEPVETLTREQMITDAADAFAKFYFSYDRNKIASYVDGLNKGGPGKITWLASYSKNEAWL